MDWKTFIPVLISLLLILAPFLKAKIKELKFIQDRHFGEMADKIVDWGVARAESWAKGLQNKPSSEDKLKTAVEKTKEYAKNKLPKNYFDEDELISRIEAALYKNKHD